MRKNARIRIHIPIVHFILSFFFETVFDGKVITAIAKSSVISNRGEFLMGYVIAKIIALLFILFFWKLFFYVIDNFERRFVKGFLIAGVLGFVLICLCFPDCFGYGVYGEYSDNLITFSYGVRMLPEYWHSAYSSLIYAASMEVFPTPFAIPFFQWLFLMFDLGYVYLRVSDELKVSGPKKYALFLIAIIPESWFLATYAYRTEGYAILCMFFFSLILLDLVTGRKRTNPELLGLCVLAGFVSVWRTEGIILGVAGIIILLGHNFGKYISGAVKFGVIFAASLVLLMIPQKLGDMKYYGSDYTIINSFAVIRNIFNREDSNLSYPGAEEDIAAIEAVVPIEIIRLYGLEGYRRYNVMMGHVDINQSIPDFGAGKAYSAAYRNLGLHNVKAYALTQIGKLKAAVKFTTEDYIEKIHGNFSLSREYPEYSFPAWKQGEDELYSFEHVALWRELPFRKKIGSAVISFVRAAENLMQKTYIATLIIAAVVGLSFICLVNDFAVLVSKKKKAGIYSCFFLVSLVLFAEAGAIFLVMPAGVLSYFRTVIMCMFLMLYIRLTAFSSQYLQR